jgi:hypothetical protein
VRVLNRALRLPPPAELQSPALGGTEAHLRELFGDHAIEFQISRKFFNFRYASPAHWIQVFRDYYGPTHKAFAAFDPNGQQLLEKDLLALIDRFNTAGVAGGSLGIP